MSQITARLPDTVVPKETICAWSVPVPIPISLKGIRQIGAILHAKAVSATVVKPFQTV